MVDAGDRGALVVLVRDRQVDRDPGAGAAGLGAERVGEVLRKAKRGCGLR
jgi:hypothetical protein